jgi:MFS family permease
MSAYLVSFRSLALICLASTGWAFSFGLGAPLASLWVRDAHALGTITGLDTSASFLATLIGLSTSIYYLGIALAALAVPAMMRRWGRGCVVAGMLGSGLSVACLPWAGAWWLWLALRLVNGITGAMTLIPLETFVNRHSPPGQRSRNFGFYAFAIALGWAVGNLIGLQMYEATPRLAFVLGGLVTCFAPVFLLALPIWPAEECVEREAHSVKRSFFIAPRLTLHAPRFLSYGSAWSQGFLEGGMVAFLAVYLLFLGLSEAHVSWLTSGIMIGVILFQVPVAWLADRLGRTAVLIGCYVVTAAGLGFLPFCGASVWLGVWLFLVGACSGSFYPLGLALLGERLPKPRLARANAWYLGINCCGSLIGPVITGWAMDRLGQPAMFLVAETAVGSVLLFWLASRWTQSGRCQPSGARGQLSDSSPLSPEPLSPDTVRREAA